METIPMASQAQNDNTSATGQPKPLLQLIPLDDTVVFPNMGITLTVDVGDDKRVVLVPRHDNEFLDVGTVAEVSERIRLPRGGPAHAGARARVPRVGGGDPRAARRPRAHLRVPARHRRARGAGRLRRL